MDQLLQIRRGSQQTSNAGRDKRIRHRREVVQRGLDRFEALTISRTHMLCHFTYLDNAQESRLLD